MLSIPFAEAYINLQAAHQQGPAAVQRFLKDYDQCHRLAFYAVAGQYLGQIPSVVADYIRGLDTKIMAGQASNQEKDLLVDLVGKLLDRYPDKMPDLGLKLFPFRRLTERKN